MKDWKTTVTAIVAALGFFARAYGVPEEVAQGIDTVIGGALVLFGYFAKDKASA